MKCKTHNRETNLFVYGRPLCELCCEELIKEDKITKETK